MNNHNKFKLKEWKKNSKKLNNTYLNFERLVIDCKKYLGSNYYISHTSKGITGVQPYELIDYDSHHTCRDGVYYIIENRKYVQIDMHKLVKDLSKKLAEKLTPEKLMKDVLYSTEPDELKEIFERVIIKEGKVKESEGCFKLLLGGKPGSPYELMIRS